MIQTSFSSIANVACRPGVAASQGQEPTGDPRETFTFSLSPTGQPELTFGKPQCQPYVCMDTGKLHLVNERPPRPYVSSETGKLHLPAEPGSSWTAIA